MRKKKIAYKLILYNYGEKGISKNGKLGELESDGK